MNAIKLSDFARQQGVTPRAVQQLLKKYECEIEGHFERKGQNGTWFDEVAQDFLRSKMLQKPIVTYDATAQPLLEENEALKTKVADLQESLMNAYKVMADDRARMNEEQMRLQGDMVKLQLIEAAKADAEQKVIELSEKNEQLTRENSLLVSKKLDVELELEEVKERAETAEDIARANEQEADLAKAEAKDLKLEVERLKKRSLWQRIWNKD